MGQNGENGFDPSARRFVHARSGDHRARTGVEKGFAKGSGLRDADAELLHQSGWPKPDSAPKSGVGESESSVVEEDRDVPQNSEALRKLAADVRLLR